MQIGVGSQLLPWPQSWKQEDCTGSLGYKIPRCPQPLTYSRKALPLKGYTTSSPVEPPAGYQGFKHKPMVGFCTQTI